MREIDCEEITREVKAAFIKANMHVSDKLENCMKECINRENSQIAGNILNKLVENIKLAREINAPICQDTGMAVLFVKLGQDVRIVNGLLNNAINQGVREAYIDGDLRLSIVGEPLFNRQNTNDNTPAIIHVDIVEGDKLEIICLPKGFGSENASRIKMFAPSVVNNNQNAIIDFIVETVKLTGGNSCPPLVVGVGIGGDFEYCARLAKYALTREIGVHNENEWYHLFELKALEAINETGIGPQGLGGKTSAFAVNVEYFATHIAGLPVAVNVCCHVYRHAKIVL